MSRESGAAGILLGGLVDYAGAFPPESLPVADALSRYERYARSEDAWMLHRLVVPASELDRVASGVRREAPVPLAVVCPDDDAVARALAFRHERARVASLETLRPLRTDREVFVERPLPVEPGELDALAASGAMLKIRLGGVSTPTSSDVASVLLACAARGLSLKATAGLHHAIRSESHGFVNLVVAAALAALGAERAEIARVLEESDPGAFALGPEAVRFRGRAFGESELADARKLLRSFGSCSFDEPVESLAPFRASGSLRP